MRDFESTKNLLKIFITESRRVTFSELCGCLKENGYQHGREIFRLPGYHNIHVWKHMDKTVSQALYELLEEKQICLTRPQDDFDMLIFLDRTEKHHPLRRKYRYVDKIMDYKSPCWMPHWLTAADYSDIE